MLCNIRHLIYVPAPRPVALEWQPAFPTRRLRTSRPNRRSRNWPSPETQKREARKIDQHVDSCMCVHIYMGVCKYI